MYKVTDKHTGKVTLAERDDVVDVLRDMYPPLDAGGFVETAIDDLVVHMMRGEYYGEEEAYLQVTVERY